ncbi:MAG: hypothetical protein J5819_00055 [Eubacterium sp.]|nr:hypothetical protein [Eubacterium sp.]
MKTDVIKIGTHGEGMKEAVQVVSELGDNAGLSPKENLHLQLMTEELLGMMRGITGEYSADWWVEYNGQSFVLKLFAKVNMTQEVRMQFIDASSSKKNEAAKGFMGRLKNAIGAVMVGMDSPAVGASAGLLNMGGPSVYAAEAHTWSLEKYKAVVGEYNSDEANEEWDELEKSIMANIADDVKVSIKGSDVEIGVYKDFSK